MFWPLAKMPPMIATMPMTTAVIRATRTSSSGVDLAPLDDLGVDVVREATRSP